MAESPEDIASPDESTDPDEQVAFLSIRCSRRYLRRVREHCKALRVPLPYYFDGLIAKDFAERGLGAPPDRVPARTGRKGRKGGRPS